MRSISTALQEGLEAGALVPRDFLWITLRDRSTGAPQTFGLWSGLGTLSAPVLDPETGEEVTRVYRGVGAILEIGAVPLVSGLTVQTVEVLLNHIEPDVEQALRGHDMTRAPVELHRGFLDPVSMRLVGSAVPRFSGFVDEAPVSTPAEGGEGSVNLTLASHTQDLTRASTAKRSDADQRRRNSTDGFFRHAATVGGWKISWGQESE